MTVALRVPSMSREAFLDWSGHLDGRYEFDGFQPVAMTGGGNAHSLICQRLYRALGSRLAGSHCTPMGPDAGVATAGGAVRYPDALVTCSPVALREKLVAGVVIVFEVVSPGSGHRDRIVKAQEYSAVGSIRRYVMIESASKGLTSLARATGEQAWTATTLVAGDMLELAEIGIALPVAELYAGLDIPGDDAG